MNGLRECYTKWSKSDREGEISYDISYVWNIKRNDTNEVAYKTDRVTDLENEFMVAQGNDGGKK